MIFKVLHKDFEKRKICEKSVPHNFMDQQKEHKSQLAKSSTRPVRLIHAFSVA
jgi:hypothetical protein